ncbi:MAG: GNAT family N-acetyltransferase [Prochlorotrichaceae cyanobacterium]|jgi:GNAT superfamily N-acetyltransferase
MNSICIRPAQPEDLETIVAFINALAHYEHLEDQVVGNPEELKEHLFGPPRSGRPPVEAVLAEMNQLPVGIAIFFPNYSTFEMKAGLYLEDIFVLPEYRNQGVGRSLFQYLAEIAVERDYGRFEWRVLDWNDMAISFYQRMGAEVLPDWYTCRITGENLKQLAYPGDSGT